MGQLDMSCTDQQALKLMETGDHFMDSVQGIWRFRRSFALIAH
jgi:hypothetical protein